MIELSHYSTSNCKFRQNITELLTFFALKPGKCVVGGKVSGNFLHFVVLGDFQGIYV